MLANKILVMLCGILGIVIIPIQIVTTFVLGILARLSFGLILIPFSLAWIVVLFPMLAVSWFCSKVTFLRNFLGILGIPWALLADVYVSLLPSMGELESRAAKIMLAESWPYSWECWQFQRHRLDMQSLHGVQFEEVLERISDGDLIKQRTITRLRAGLPLDEDF